MKIIVCIKQVPSTNEVRMDRITNTIIRDGIEAVMNPFDTYAVEEAIRLNERFGARMYGLTMGIPAAESILRESISLGFEGGYLLSDRAFAGADTLATAQALKAGIIKAGMPDLVLCGKMASDGDTGQVGPMLGEMLDVPHVTDVSSIITIEGGTILCRRMTDDGYEEVKVNLPAVVTVVKEINVPRLPSISGMLRGRHADITLWTSDDLEVSQDKIGILGSPTQVVRSFVPELNHRCEYIEEKDSSPAEQILSILREKQLISKVGNKEI